MQMRCFHIFLLLLVTQVGIGQDSTHTSWIYNPTRDIEIRYETLKSDSNIYDGSYRLFNDGKPQIIGNYLNNLKHGEWKRLYPSGIVSMRTAFSEGFRNGTCSYFYPDGELASVSSYNFDLPNGHWKGYHENGHISHEIVYVTDAVKDYETYYHENGKKAHEIYYSYGNAAIYQVEKKFYIDNKPYVEAYRKNGALDSIYRKYHSNGKLWEEFIYKEGLLIEVKANNDREGNPKDKGTFSAKNGILKRYHASGEMHSAITYKNGIRDGAVTYYDKEQMLWKGQYKNDLRDGVWEEYGKKKKMERTFTYFEGIDSVYVQKYFGKGLRIASYCFVRGLIHGTSVAFDFVGDTLKTTAYVDGVKHGVSTVYKNGRLLEKGEYQSGEKSGKWNIYNASGKVTQTQEFTSEATHAAASFKQEDVFQVPEIFDDYGYKPTRIVGDFYGGSYAEYRYIAENLLYPDLANQASKHGDVVVEINLSALGEVIGLRVIRGIGYHCDEEALGVISAVPFWEPELLNGFPVPTTLLRTISF